jgi:hypothetical protein
MDHVCFTFSNHITWCSTSICDDATAMGELCWLNNLWFMALEEGDEAWTIQRELIEAAHLLLDGLFHGEPTWVAYLAAYNKL